MKERGRQEITSPPWPENGRRLVSRCFERPAAPRCNRREFDRPNTTPCMRYMYRRGREREARKTQLSEGMDGQASVILICAVYLSKIDDPKKRPSTTRISNI